MRSFRVVHSSRPFRLCQGTPLPTLLCASACQTTTPPPPSPSPPSSSSSSSAPRGLSLSREDGISSGLGGIGHYNGSLTAFMKPVEQKEAEMKARMDGPLPCDTTRANPTTQAAEADYMASVAMTGRLPSPRQKKVRVDEPVQRPVEGTTKLPSAAPSASSLPRRAPPPALGEATPITRKSSLPRPATAPPKASSSPSSSPPEAPSPLHQEAEDYYRSLPTNELSKEEMWARINAASADRAAETATAMGTTEVDYYKLEEELREFDLFHYRMGEIGYPDEQIRRDYYAMWNLAMSLNKARWTMLEVHSQRGMKTTGAGMKLLFWKESVGAIIEKRKMSSGQFTDSHPVLRPFAAAVERNPTMTKAFVRGFTDARLRVIQQPGNVQQLFDHFDKFYGYFYNSLLEVTHVKDEAAEHLMVHIGRATGLTNHCVMFWKKYARLGFTMLPADLCADNHVNLGLLKNIALASQDLAVRKLLADVMSIAKDEMLHAEKIAKDVAPAAWPVVMECLYPNYYLGFLQRQRFNVSAMFADYNIENAGFTWYRLKKRWEWERYQSIEKLLSESAPLPFIGTSLKHRGSSYKMASGIGQGEKGQGKKAHAHSHHK